MLIMGFNGSEINENSPVAQWLSTDGLGGILLFDKDLSMDQYGKNLINQTQIKQLIHQLNYYSSVRFLSSEAPLPLLTAIDYEGGVVDRLARIDGCMTTMRAADLARLSATDFDEQIEQMAATLKSLGFNLNFAPVVDLSLNDQQGIIGALGRSFSNNPEIVVRAARRFVELLSNYGIGCCYKHFPGHGSAIGDTHEGFVDVTDTFQMDELVPYRSLLKDKEKPVMIMTAHVINRQLDTKGLPATLSHELLTGLLRETMGYEGVIISDDLQMQAISKHYSLEESLELTINAGADMVIFANQLDTITAPEVIDCIEQLVLEHKISEQRIEEAFKRVTRFKQQINSRELVHP
jgi:beta-N-acetylhexosaminidase